MNRSRVSFDKLAYKSDSTVSLTCEPFHASHFKPTAKSICRESLYHRCCVQATNRTLGILGGHWDQAILEAHNDRKLLSIQLLLLAIAEQKGCWSSFQLLDSKLGSSSLKNLNSDACNLQLHSLLGKLWWQCSTKPSQRHHRVCLRTPRFWSDLNHRANRLMFLLSRSIDLFGTDSCRGLLILDLFTNRIDPWLNCNLTP